MICLKIRTFVVSATTRTSSLSDWLWLWFAWKFVPLWYQQQRWSSELTPVCVVICLKIRTFVVSATTMANQIIGRVLLWFAWKFVPLWYQQQHPIGKILVTIGCDLLENSYLCGISNNRVRASMLSPSVVICLKIRTFVVSATTYCRIKSSSSMLWFAWKFVPLWYQQQRHDDMETKDGVVICLKIRTFVVSATTLNQWRISFFLLWFAWKFVPLWYQQQHQQRWRP